MRQKQRQQVDAQFLSRQQRVVAGQCSTTFVCLGHCSGMVTSTQEPHFVDRSNESSPGPTIMDVLVLLYSRSADLGRFTSGSEPQTFSHDTWLILMLVAYDRMVGYFGRMLVVPRWPQRLNTLIGTWDGHRTGFHRIQTHTRTPRSVSGGSINIHPSFPPFSISNQHKRQHTRSSNFNLAQQSSYECLRSCIAIYI